MCDVNVNNTKLKINEIIQNNQLVSFTVCFTKNHSPFQFFSIGKSYSMKKKAI